MKSSPMEMFEPSNDDRLNNKENVVLRSLVGDPNRHVPLADHQPSSMYSNGGKPPASLYTLDTRYQPIPSKALPKPTDPRVYYIDSIRREESPIMTERMSNRQTTPVPPTVFLEPKIISQPILYSIIDSKYSPPIPDERIQANKPPIDTSPTLYALNDRPRRPTMDINDDKPPAMYSVLGSPRPPNAHEEPINRYQQPAPHLYSITGNPTRASRGVQVNTFNPDQPAPILYTIVGDTPNRTERSFDKPLPTNKSTSNTEQKPYTIITETTTPRVYQQPASTNKPSIYTLVGQPNSSYIEDNTRTSPRKRTPPPPATTISTTRSTTRSLERKPETVREEVISYPVVERKQPRFPKELKPEPIYIPSEERRARPPPPPSQSNPKPYIMSQSQPVPITSYRTYKPYRERNPTNNNYTPLPIVTHTHSNRKPRPALYEPRYQPEKHYPYVPVKHTSSERYPVDPRPSLWNTGYQSDDEQAYDQRTPRKKRIYNSVRPRAPWIPVW